MSQQHFGLGFTSRPVIISPPCFLSLVLHRYFSPAKTNTARWTCASIPTIRFMWTLVLSCVRVCILIDVCVQLLLYMFRGQHKIIPQQGRSKSSTKPPSPFLTCQYSKWQLGPLLFSRHPMPSAIAKYTPYEPYTTYFDRPLQSTAFMTALIGLRQLKMFKIGTTEDYYAVFPPGFFLEELQGSLC